MTAAPGSSGSVGAKVPRGTNVQHDQTFRVVLEKPPAGVDYGVRMGRGAESETAQKQRSKGKDCDLNSPLALRPANLPRLISVVRSCRVR